MQLVCLRCNKHFAAGTKLFLMRFLLADHMESAKIKTYNFISTKILEFVGCKHSVEELHKMNRYQLKTVLAPLLHRTFTMTLVSNIIVYDEVRYENHSIKDIFF
jgi:hypothetical protein